MDDVRLVALITAIVVFYGVDLVITLVTMVYENLGFEDDNTGGNCEEEEECRSSDCSDDTILQ